MSARLRSYGYNVSSMSNHTLYYVKHQHLINCLYVNCHLGDSARLSPDNRFDCCGSRIHSLLRMTSDKQSNSREQSTGTVYQPRHRTNLRSAGSSQGYIYTLWYSRNSAFALIFSPELHSFCCYLAMRHFMHFTNQFIYSNALIHTRNHFTC